MKECYNSDECSSWNCCDEMLKENINRCDYVQNIRNQLRKKKLKKNIEIK
ncbi:MAG: hypothetical protein ACFFDF_01755 [Candidatus Odinarchaeota archaeon]